MVKIRGNPLFKWIALIFLIGFSAAFQYNAAHYFAVAGVIPNLLLVTAITAGFALGSESGGFAGICLGLYQDAQSGKILGMYALFYLYAGVIAGFFPKKSNLGDFPTALIAVYALTLLSESAVYLFAYAIPILRGGLTPGTDLLRAAVRVIVPASFVNAFWCIPFFFILRPGAAPA